MNRELKLLSRLYGIAQCYFDCWGNKHLLLEEVAKKILSSLGVRAETSGEVTQTIIQHKKNYWTQILPPVKLVEQGLKPIKLILTLPMSSQKQVGLFRFYLEGGKCFEKKFLVSELKLIRGKVIAGTEYGRFLYELPLSLDLGYHKVELQIAENKLTATTQLIVVPEKAFIPEIFKEKKKVWGVAAQLYSLNSKSNWGIGDYSDLSKLVQTSADVGASLVGLSPLHANFVYNPEQVSPYSPSSRMAFNTMYIDVEAVDGFAECEEVQQLINSLEFKQQLSELKTVDKVDNIKVSSLKLQVLELLYQHFYKAENEFLNFVKRRGNDLQQYAMFEALAESLSKEDPSCWGWPVWPEEYRDPNSSAVKIFAEKNQQRIQFFKFLQWIATKQLSAVVEKTKEKKMPIGLYFDLALSADRVGVDVWADQNSYALGLKVGCPPDVYSLEGQDWGFAPLKPKELKESAFTPFIQALRFNMQFSGSLRLDHVMSLKRLFCVPLDTKMKYGAYIRYPFEEMLGILCLESVRNKCLIVGEDLGTVPRGFTERMAHRGILSYKVLSFMKNNDGSFVGLAGYPSQALVTSTTHDMATLWGFWQAEDIKLRRRVNLITDETSFCDQLEYRKFEKTKLLEILCQEGILSSAYLSQDALSELTETIFLAIQKFLARTATQVLVVPLEDILKQFAQVNLPGVVAEYPSWQHRLKLSIEELKSFDLFDKVQQIMHEEKR